MWKEGMPAFILICGKNKCQRSFLFDERRNENIQSYLFY